VKDVNGVLIVLLKEHAEIMINNSPENIWDYANNPENWAASNPEEHRGLKFYNKSNRPETGVEFYQKEFVAGIYADLRGQILYADRPNVVVWTGVAKYKVFGGLIRPRIPEGGTVRIQKTNKGFKVSHDVFMDFPDTLFGKVMLWYFTKILKGEKAVYDHTYKELVFFKNQLEK